MFEAVWDRFDDMVLGDPNERLSVLKAFYLRRHGQQ